MRTKAVQVCDAAQYLRNEISRHWLREVSLCCHPAGQHGISIMGSALLLSGT